MNNPVKFSIIMMMVQKLPIIVFVYLFFHISCLGEAEIKYDWDKLFAGKIFVEAIEQQKLPGIRLTFTLDTSRESVWDMLTDNTILNRLYTDCDKALVLEEKPGHAVIQYWITILFQQYNYTLKCLYDAEAYRITWTKVGGDFKQIYGYWAILPTSRPGISLIIGESFLESGFAYPRWFEDWIKMIKSRDLALNFRKWISKHR